MKISMIVLIIMVSFMFLGCGFIFRKSGLLNKFDLEVLNAGKYKTEKSNQVIKALNEKDTEALKALFCERTRDLDDIDEQIQRGFKLVKGKIISFNGKLLGYEGESSENGKKTLLERAWGVNEARTDDGKTHKIGIRAYVIFALDEKREGITQITVSSEDGGEVLIGYAWPEYYNEGQALAVKLVKAFDGHDSALLKSLLSAQTASIAGIDGEIREGFDFYRGRAIQGRPRGSGTEYDGSRDYHISVRDEETVEKGKPVLTSVTVLVWNIETDEGKKYEIAFTADILNTRNKAAVGIRGMTISEKDGLTKTIGSRIDDGKR